MVQSCANRKITHFACSNNERNVLQILSMRTFIYLSKTPVCIFKMIYFAELKVLYGFFSFRCNLQYCISKKLINISI